jgi:hypothetical protein
MKHGKVLSQQSFFVELIYGTGIDLIRGSSCKINIFVKLSLQPVITKSVLRIRMDPYLYIHLVAGSGSKFGIEIWIQIWNTDPDSGVKKLP